MRSGYGPSLTPKLLLDFINAGGNVLLGLSADSTTPSSISSLLLELDISLSQDRSSIVVDHFNYDTASAAEKHDVLLVPRPGPLRPDVKNFFGGDGVLALPKTVGQSLGSASPLLVPILKAPATAYSYNPKEDGESTEDPFATGSQLMLISAMQARNSARFTVLGSLEMLEDKWFDASVKVSNGKSTKTVNREFAKQLSAWTFKEVGVLKVGKVSHYEVTDASKKGGNSTQVGFQNPGIYRIKNDVVRIGIIHFSHKNILTPPHRPSTLNSPNTPIITTRPSSPPPQTASNLNSACSRPSTAFHSTPSAQRPTAPSSAHPSNYQTNTGSSPSRSTTSAPS